MRAHNFTFSNRKNHYEVAKERTDIQFVRENYLRWVMAYREQGYTIFYQDETWVFKNIAHSNVWQDNENAETLYKVPSVKGERSIVCHLGSDETGLLDGCFLMYRGSKSNKSSDYHTEMKADVFMDRCKMKVFPALQNRGKRAVPVLDRATYHTMLTAHSKRIVKSASKSAMIDEIDRWGGPPNDWPENWRHAIRKAEMFQHAMSIQPPVKYLVQEAADNFTIGDFHIKFLMLPVAHPELNPIEMVWGNIKRQAASTNHTF
jgi:hypothetical protein